MKLLVVENNMNLQHLYKDELEEEGYDVVLASTGKDAMEKFAAPGGYRRDPNIMPGLTDLSSVCRDH